MVIQSLITNKIVSHSLKDLFLWFPNRILMYLNNISKNNTNIWANMDFELL